MNILKSLFGLLISNSLWTFGLSDTRPKHSVPRRGERGWEHNPPNGRTFTSQIDEPAVKMAVFGATVFGGLCALMLGCCWFYDHFMR